MAENGSTGSARFVHIVTLDCKSGEHAQQCLSALASYGRPDAVVFGCASYEFGTRAGAPDSVYIVEQWGSWDDLDRLLVEKVVPALPLYNQLLKRPFDPVTDTLRVELAPAAS